MRLARGALTLGPRLGSGAQGDVFVLTRAKGFSAPFALVYKEFGRRVSVNGAALEAMVELRFGLEPPDREFLDRHATWPLVVVEDAGRVVGYLMQAVPRQFFQEFRLSTGTRSRPRELQQLFQDDDLSRRNLGFVPTWRERLRIARVAAQVLEFLHAHDLVFGDLSYKNEVWCIRPSPSVMYVDCDTIRLRGQSSALPQAHSPGWEPPERATVQTIETDRYKLGLLVLRCLTPEVNAQHRDPAAADARLDDDGRALLRLALGDDPAQRPSGARWVAYLDRAITLLPAEPVRSGSSMARPAPPPPMVHEPGRNVPRRPRVQVPRRAARAALPNAPARTVYGTTGASWKSPTPSPHGFGHPPGVPSTPLAGGPVAKKGFWRTGQLSTGAVVRLIAVCVIGIVIALTSVFSKGSTPRASAPTTEPKAATTPLFRYFKPGSAADGTVDDHGTHPRQTIEGYTQERSLGSAANLKLEGTTAIYECRGGPGGVDSYTSVDPECSGDGPGQVLGYVLDYPRAGVTTVPLYRCIAGEDRFDSTDLACEGHQKDLLIGYLVRG